jgi:endonuclease G
VAKLRRNHDKGSKGFGASLTRITIALILLVFGLFMLAPKLGSYFEQAQSSMTSSGGGKQSKASATKGKDRIYLPVGPSDQIVHHAFYSLGYDNDWEQPRWVAYELTPEMIRNRNVKRTDEFRPDPDVKDRSAVRNDYRRSGYSRGHLVPAGDMGFDETAMSETFFYSNMSPQLAVHNGAVWRELEETSRDWILEKGPTYIVTGPIVGKHPKRIGDNQVAVPDAFYRVMLTEDGEGIGFIIPHEKQTEPLENFAVSIDKVEKVTGLDFFPEQTDLATAEVEAKVDKRAWPHDDRRYNLRLKSWNKQR